MEIKHAKIPSPSLTPIIGPVKSSMKTLKLKGSRSVQISEDYWPEGDKDKDKEKEKDMEKDSDVSSHIVMSEGNGIGSSSGSGSTVNHENLMDEDTSINNTTTTITATTTAVAVDAVTDPLSVCRSLGVINIGALPSHSPSTIPAVNSVNADSTTERDVEEKNRIDGQSNGIEGEVISNSVISLINGDGDNSTLPPLIGQPVSTNNGTGAGAGAGGETILSCTGVEKNEKSGSKSNGYEGERMTAIARISYLGWGEHYDAWIEVDSLNLAKLDTQSDGRRGDGSLREEVIFLVNLGIKNNAISVDQNNQNNHNNVTANKVRFTASGSEEQGVFHSQDLADVINTFGDSQGFE